MDAPAERLWKLHCDGVGCPTTDLYDPLASVSVHDPGTMTEDDVIAEGEATCEAYNETAPQCFRDLFCDGNRVYECRCVVVEVRDLTGDGGLSDSR